MKTIRIINNSLVCYDDVLFLSYPIHPVCLKLDVGDDFRKIVKTNNRIIMSKDVCVQNINNNILGENSNGILYQDIWKYYEGDIVEGEVIATPNELIKDTTVKTYFNNDIATGIILDSNEDSFTIKLDTGINVRRTKNEIQAVEYTYYFYIAEEEYDNLLLSIYNNLYSRALSHSDFEKNLFKETKTKLKIN